MERCTDPARHLVKFGTRAIGDARRTNISTWRRLQAAYDGAVCAVAVLGDRRVRCATVEEEALVLEKLLQHVQLDAAAKQALRRLSARRCRPAHLHSLTAEHEVEDALQVVEPLLREAALKIARQEEGTMPIST